MQTKQFYYDGIWSETESHPDYDLGRRELAALIRFLPLVYQKRPAPLNVLHLASATGREVPHILQHIPVSSYVLNDICEPVVRKSEQLLIRLFPHIQFSAKPADIEQEGIIKSLRDALLGPTLILLVANGVIFSNPKMDHHIFHAMKEGDLFLLTLETPHEHIFDSYMIDPVFKLLSQSGIQVTKKNAQFSYDIMDQRMKISCEGRVLLSSYKPSVEQLRARMVTSTFSEVVLESYPDIHICASLWEKT